VSATTELIAEKAIDSERLRRGINGDPPMKIVRCNVSKEVVRVDLAIGDTTYLGAALHGAGGIMADWTSVAARMRLKARNYDEATIYTKHRADGDEVVKAPAQSVQLLAVYAPGYEASR
jgi:hypothetical protein